MTAAVNNEFNHKDGVSLRHYVDELNESHCRKCDEFRGMCRTGIDKQFVTQVQAQRLAKETVNESNKLARDTIDREFQSITKATDLAREGVERRLDKIDETLREEQQGSITKNEYFAANKTFTDKIGTLEVSFATMEGKASQKAVTFAYLLTGAALLLSTVSIIFWIALK